MPLRSQPFTRPLARVALATLLASCRFDVGASVRGAGDSGPHAADGAAPRENDEPEADGASAPNAPPPSGAPERPGLGSAGGGDAGSFGTWDADSSPGPVARVPEAGALDGAPMEAAVGGSAARATCPRSASDGSTSPHSLKLLGLRRLEQPALQNRPLGPVAFLGEERLWLFRAEFREVADQGNAGGDMPLAAYDRAPAGELTPTMPLEFTVGSSPFVARLADEPFEPNNLAGVSIEPASLVTSVGPQISAVVFLYKIFGFDETRSETWLGDVQAGDTHATRRMNALWRDVGTPSPAGAVRGPQYLTLYRCDYKPGTCTVARAPNGSEGVPAAYEYRTRDASGNWTWSRDSAAATPVLTGVHADLTISKNEYLQKYLAVHLEAEALEDTIVLQTAVAPEGPWSLFATIDVRGAPKNFIRLAREQPALGDACGKRVAISYFEPKTLVGLYPASGSAVLGYVELP